MLGPHCDIFGQILVDYLGITSGLNATFFAAANVMEYVSGLIACCLSQSALVMSGCGSSDR